MLCGGSSSTGADSYAWRIRGDTNFGNGWSSQAPIGTQGAQFDSSTVGYSNIHISFDLYTTTNAEANLALEYTTNGTQWNVAPMSYSGNAAQILTNISSQDTVIGSYLNVTNAPTSSPWVNGISANLSGSGIVNNNPYFGIRLVNASTGVDCINQHGLPYNNTTGNWRFDNILIQGQAVPEPSTYVLFGLGAIGMLMVMRRKKISL